MNELSLARALVQDLDGHQVVPVVQVVQVVPVVQVVHEVVVGRKNKTHFIKMGFIFSIFYNYFTQAISIIFSSCSNPSGSEPV